MRRSFTNSPCYGFLFSWTLLPYASLGLHLPPVWPPLASFWRRHRGWNDFMSMTFGSPLAPLGFLWPKWIPELCNIWWPSAPFALFGILLEWTEYNAIYITNWGTKYATLGILSLCCSIHSRICEVIMRCVLWGGCGGLVRMQFLGGSSSAAPRARYLQLCTRAIFLHVSSGCWIGVSLCCGVLFKQFGRNYFNLY